MTDAEGKGPTTGTRMLRDDTLVVFVSDTHIGGDPGLDYFESPEDLGALFGELATRHGPVELVLTGDFFDLLKIGEVLPGENRASATINRPEYRGVFSALRSVAGGADRRVVYLPGNHDAEVWWNQGIRSTLREEGLVDEFALSYAARFESIPDRLIYCEHGNQFDPANAFADYDDPLDTPFGDHIVTDVVRRISSAGRIGRDLNLREMGMVYPLVSIPGWVAGRVFYDLLSRVAAYLLLPLLIGYALYRVVAYGIATSPDGSRSISLWDSYATLPGVQAVFGEIAWDALLLVTVLVLFFVAVRRAANRAIGSVTSGMPGKEGGTLQTDSSAGRIEALLGSDGHPPQRRGLRGREIDVFVSGHTHAPALSQVMKGEGKSVIVVNSGCWLRQLRPIPVRFGGPPVYVSEFVQTHARVYLEGAEIRAELWERPKPAPQRLRAAERLAVLGRLPARPAAEAKPRVSALGTLPKDR